MGDQPEQVRRALDAVGEAAVERDLFVSPGADEIVATVDAFCRAHLGAGLDRYEFCRSGVGSVHGVELVDGRQVVVKVHAPWLSAAVLESTHAIRAYLHGRGFPTAAPVLGPTPLGRGLATVEALVPATGLADGHDPGTRCLLASTLARLVDETRPFGADADLPPLVPMRRLYPVPRRRGVDLEDRGAGTAWIDELALEARIRHRDEGRRVVGHGDWRTQNVAIAEGRVLAVFDWDSLRYELEPVLVGHAAAAHTADHRLLDHRDAPSPDELRGFVADYEDATGHRFRGAARATVFAAAVHHVCFAARLEVHGDPTAAPGPGTYQQLLAEHASELLNS